MGAVASPHYLTTQFGKEILNAGGHAVEAAIATNAVLNVMYPHMSGLGGDLMAIIWDSKEQKPVEINGTGYLGENISIKDFSDLNAIPIRGPKSAITVPGTVEVWWEMHKKYGKLRWKDLFKEAIDYAKKAFLLQLN